MPIWIPHQGEELILDILLATNLTLRLYQNDVTAGLTEAQTEALTESDFTEASFVGYSAKALTGGSWVTTQGDPTAGTYAQQTYTRTSTGTAQTIYGYYVTRTSDNKLLWFERFTGPVITSTNGDVIRVTPTFEVDDNQEATVTARGLVVAPQVLTSDSSAFTADGTSDMTLVNVPVDSSRSYMINFHSAWGANAAFRWLAEVQIDGATLARLGDGQYLAALNGVWSARIPWLPATGTPTITVKVVEVTGTATFTLVGASTTPRYLSVEDVGARL